MKPWPIPKLWHDKPTVVILAGGPSLTLADVRLVALAHARREIKAIAVNDAVFVAWFADWLHACDAQWWAWHGDAASRFRGVRTCCEVNVNEAYANYLRVPTDKETGWRGGFAEDPSEVAGGGNAGYQAIQIAIKAGGGKVILLGFDMRPGLDNRRHWFGDHPNNQRSDYIRTMLPYFPSLAEACKERGIDVVNATPGSAIDVFRRAKLGDLI